MVNVVPSIAALTLTGLSTMWKVRLSSTSVPIKVMVISLLFHSSTVISSTTGASLIGLIVIDAVAVFRFSSCIVYCFSKTITP